MGFLSSLMGNARIFKMKGTLVAIEESLQTMATRGQLKEFENQVNIQWQEAMQTMPYKSVKEMIRVSSNNSANAFSVMQKDIPAYTAIIVIGMALESMLRVMFIEDDDEMAGIYRSIRQMLKSYQELNELDEELSERLFQFTSKLY